MTAYYNEINKYCAEWLKNLMSEGLIAKGDVDTRSIIEVTPADLKGYTQCHFFAGIGIWSGALKKAGWSDNKQVWTGSCPCQPFSQSGQQKGVKDERHLWPVFHELIKSCRPSVIFGEQVSGAGGLAWFDIVQADLQDSSYASAGLDLCSAGVGAPNIRQRLYWVGHSDSTSGQQFARAKQSAKGKGESSRGELGRRRDGSAGSGKNGSGLADSAGEQLQCHAGKVAISNSENEQGHAERYPIGLVNADSDRQQKGGKAAEADRHGNPANSTSWNDTEIISFSDGKRRPIKPRIEPVVARNPARVEQVRAYGNALNMELATEFVRGFMDFNNVSI